MPLAQDLLEDRLTDDVTIYKMLLFRHVKQQPNQAALVFPRFRQAA